jgi:Flp pilus assembly protein CpaB
MPILKQMAVTRTELISLAIPAGMKVVGIRVPPDDMIGGLLTPGDLVDLVGVFSGPKNSKVSRTFLTNIQVFSIDNQTAAEVDRQKKGTGGAIVGVLLTKSQAEQLILAQNVAQIKLLMTSPDQVATNSPVSEGFSPDDWENGSEPQPETARGPDFGKILNGLVKGTFNPDDSHTVVMITPEGPTSYVFVKDMPLPQKIDGYFTPQSLETKKVIPPPAPTNDLPISDDFNDFDDRVDSPVKPDSDLR